jgi:hypothetical protein
LTSYAYDDENNLSSITDANTLIPLEAGLKVRGY